MNQRAFDRLMDCPPKLHFWGNEWRVGGLALPQLRLVERAVKGLGDRIEVIETGAGLSTLVFLALGARVLSFFTKPDLQERISKAIDEYGLPAGDWRYVLGQSEFTFPKYLDENREVLCDLVLIDGGHLIHTVFTDFTYAFASLRQGGLMLLDDLQMPPVAVLYRILKGSTFVEEIDAAGKTVTFRKKVKARLPTSWNETVFNGLPLDDFAHKSNAR